MKSIVSTIGIVLWVLLVISCTDKTSPRFKLLSASETGIDFNNMITENDSVNVFQFMNIYTGAGVAVGDINNDGLTDVYFSGNMVSGRLYLNKGDLTFEDISSKSGILNDRWGTGATMVDINQDGWLDIYVCVSGGGSEARRANLLYVNNGNMTFSERASEFGLADTRQAMQAAFFDYDKDQDLDMYLLVNPAAYEYRVNSSSPRKLDGESVSNDRLYRNEGNGKFTDVTLEAGILVEGYGLGVGISDINNDNWPDIYVSNDFIGNDILYINQGNGQFKDQIGDYINHSSYAGMGNDVADINNDGKPDIMVLDMRPEDNERQKLIISSTGYDRFQMMLEAGYQPQYSRNTLQLNQGEGKFSEIGFMAGVSSTDWSWSPLLADFDNDGFRDMFVSNGFLRDLGNLDYIHYQNIYDNPLGDPETKIRQKLASIQDLPSAKLLNYAFKNRGDSTFENVTEAWGIDVPSCSNGAAYADLDNDGDLDILVNNINQQAFVYENTGDRNTPGHFLRIKLKGKDGNIAGIGSKIKVTSDERSQFAEQYLSRGYESSVDPVIHLGMGTALVADSVEIRWPDDTYQLLRNVATDQTIILSQAQALPIQPGAVMPAIPTWLTDVTDSLGIAFRHREDPMVDFKFQPILPHMHSRLGPGIAVADVNMDGREDFFIGGAAGQKGQLFLQDSDGSMAKREWDFDSEYEDMGTLFFDADMDGDVDLYVVSGGFFAPGNTTLYQDRLYLNDGGGTFYSSDVLPPITSSGSVVTASDFDRDGDLDLFVGGRVSPGSYPLPSKSYLLENLSDKDGRNLKFRDISGQVPGWDQLTMVSGALWSDYDTDGWVDLLVCGEFMPVTVFHNEGGKLTPHHPAGLIKSEGWWNSIDGGDVDNDGDTDYILGNLGMNSKYVATDTEPLCIYAKDFDTDGRIDPVMCYFNDGENYIAHSRDEIISQINVMRARFKTYRSYAETTFEKSFLPEELKDAYVVKSHNFASSYLENLGDGRFELHKLPMACQVGPIEGILIEDINLDGNQDIVLTGNSYAPEVASGRYDAIKGIILEGDGHGGLKSLTLEQSGFLNDMDGSGLTIMRDAQGGSYILAAANDNPLKVFQVSGVGKVLSVDWDTQYAEIFFKDGRKNRMEFYYGSGYLSQRSRSIVIHDQIKEIRIISFDGSTKTVFAD